ncbi:MAG TPA: hypothetical protein VGB54_13185, partial [Allosphingosinicella sp.]
MFRTFLFTVAAGSLAAGPSSTQPVEPQRPAAPAGSARSTGSATLPVEWTISPTDRDGIVQLRLAYDRGGRQSNNSRPVPLSELEGLDAARLAGNGPASFRFGGEAGTLHCSGTMAGGRGIGTCDFQPDQGFAAELERRGMGRASIEDMYQLSVQGVGRDLLSELDRHEYARPSVRDLVAAGIHGVSADYVREMAASGYRVGTVERLVEFRIHGVSPHFIREIAQANPNLVRLHPDRLVEMRIHGVSPELVRSLNQSGMGDLTPSQIVEMQIHSVSPDFVRGMAEAGYRDLGQRQLIEMKIHGVSP